MRAKSWKKQCSVALAACLVSCGLYTGPGAVTRAASLDESETEVQVQGEVMGKNPLADADVSGDDAGRDVVSGNDAAPEKISAAAPEGSKELFFFDFEDVEAGQMGDLTAKNLGNASMGVEVINGNHVLVLDQSQDNSSSKSNPELSYLLPENQSYDEVVFSYNVAAKTEHGVLYLPNLIGSGNATLVQLAMNTFKGTDSIQYRTRGNDSWYTVQNYESMRWYAVKVVYHNGQDGASYELYIDGQKIDQEYPNPRNSGAVRGFNSSLYRVNTGVFYLDNIHMTVGDHDPIEPGELIPEDPEESQSVAYTQDFEQVEAGSLPDGWASSNVEQTTSIEVREQDGGKLLVLDHQTAQNTSLTVRYPFANGISTKRAVLKYRVKAEGTSGALYLPSFYNSSAQLVKLAMNAGKFQKDNTGKGWVDIMPFEAGTWYEIELMLDQERGVYDLYINGQIVVSQDSPYASGDINRMGIGVYRVTSNTYYLDDFEIHDYVEGKKMYFEDSVIEVVKGQTKRLTPVFDPADTSCRSASFSSSDEEIVKVDSLGNVTGMKEGEETITAIPSLPGLAPATIRVKVTNVQPVSVEVEPQEVHLPEGGHLFLEAKVLPENVGNPKVLYVSENPDIAAVDEWGEVVALAEGTTVIHVISEEKEEIRADVPIEVKAREVMRRIYVQNNGNDSNDGSQNAPVRTLARAQELVREYNQEMTGDIEVILADGYYLLTDTWQLTEQDGGSQQHYVVYRHEGSKEAVIGGRRQISGFTVYDAEKNIYVADAAGLNTRQLYIDNVRAVRARSQGGLYNPAMWVVDGTNKGYTSANLEFLEYAHPEDLELVFQEQWTNPRCGVAGVAAAGDKVRITMDQPGWTYVSDKGGTSASTPVYYENALELLDEPGEWYLDVHEGKLYYMPRPWENLSEAMVTAPVVEELVTIYGSDYDHMVQNIEFRGITFADTTWNRPSTEYGHADAQNNHIREHGMSDRLPDAAVTVKRANSIRFMDCTFARMGITALKMVEGVQNSTIDGNRFYDISGSAINIGDPYTDNADNYYPEDLRKMMKNCDVTNNYIHDIGVDYQSAAAVSVGFAANMDLSYNEIFNIPYSAFHIGYGWAKRFENFQKNMVMSHNFIHDLMGNGIYDGGAFYFNGNSGGSDGNYNLVSENYIRNQMDLNAPLYADEGTTYWHWEKNVVDLSESPLWHNNSNPRWLLVYVDTIEHLKVNDIYTTTDNKYVNPGAPDVEITDVHVYPDAQWPAEAQSIIDHSGLQDSYADLRAGQAERIHTSVDEGELHVSLGESVALDVYGTDGKDHAVTMGDKKIAYLVEDSEIAEVSESGVVTGLKSGITTLKIYVVSNDILDVVEAKLYVGDEFNRIALRGVENDTVMMGETSKGFQAEAYGLTDLDREVVLSEITYKVVDPTIAVVDENGYITPVGAGKTVMTVTAVGEGKTVSWDFVLQIEAKQEFQPDNLWEIFGEDSSAWVVEGGSLEVVPGEKVETTLSKYATYVGCKYRNELMTFRFRIDANGKGDWPSIVLRAQSSDKAVSGGATGYIICFGSGGLELQRFNGSQRTVIYGNLDGHTSLGGPAIAPEPLTHGEEHEVAVGALTNGDSVELLLIVDGETIFDYIDEEEGAITEPGYFGLVGRGETFTLLKDTSLPDWEADKTALRAALEEASVLDGSKYTEESYGPLAELMVKAEQLLKDVNATQEDVDALAAELQAAANALVPVENEGDSGQGDDGQGDDDQGDGDQGGDDQGDSGQGDGGQGDGGQGDGGQQDAKAFFHRYPSFRQFYISIPHSLPKYTVPGRGEGVHGFIKNSYNIYTSGPICVKM